MKGQRLVSCSTSSFSTSVEYCNGISLSEDDDPFPQYSHDFFTETEVAKKKDLRQDNNNGINTSSRSKNFYRQNFPGTTSADWNDWKWQIRNRFTTIKQLGSILKLQDNELNAMSHNGSALPVSITPYYASLFYDKKTDYPLRITAVPVEDETRISAGESSDPLAEGTHSPVGSIIHRYPDRLLFLVTPFCATYCRYCTRSRIVGREKETHALYSERWKEALQYINDHREVRDVLLSGGDPLTLPDETLEWLLIRLRAIKHVEIIRIGTKVPVVLPQRVTPQLVNMLKKYHPLWMSVHFTHPDEITPETKAACERIADAGIPMGSQTVLLKRVNDNTETLLSLFQGLLRIRVRPYYLYQCDPIVGSAHFRTTVKKGIEIIRKIRGFTTGYAVPQYVIDAPGGGGKVPVNPDYLAGRKEDSIVLRNYENKTFMYPDTSV